MELPKDIISDIEFDRDSIDIWFVPMTGTEYDIECYKVGGFSEEQIHDIAIAREFLKKSPNLKSVNISVEVDIINYEDDVIPDVAFLRVGRKAIGVECVSHDMATFQRETLASRSLLWKDYDKIIKKFKLNKFIDKVN